MEKRILSLFLAVMMILSTMTMLGISAAAEDTTGTADALVENKALHILNKDNTATFLCQVLVPFDAVSSGSYVEFKIKPQQVRTNAYMGFSLEKDKSSAYEMASFVYNPGDGKYYFTKGTQYNSSYSEAIEPGEWYTVRYEIYKNGSDSYVDVKIDDNLIYTSGKRNNSWDKFIFQMDKGGNFELYVDDFTVGTLDGEVKYVEDFESTAIGKLPTNWGVLSCTNPDTTTIGVETLVTAIPAINENFDSTTVGALPEGFTVSNSDKARVENEKSFTNALHIKDRTQTAGKGFWTKISTNFTGITDGYVEFKVNPQQIGPKAYMGFSLEMQSSSSTSEMPSFIQYDGKYYITKGTAYASGVSKEIELGKWYTIRYEIYTVGSDRYVDVKIDGELIYTSGRRNNAWDKFVFQKVNTATGSDIIHEIYVDDFKVVSSKGTVEYNFDNEVAGNKETGWTPDGWTIAVREPDYTITDTTTVDVVSVEASVNEESGKVLYVEDNISDAVVNAAVALEGRAKAEIGFSYKAEQLTDGHVFAVKDAAGNNKVVLRAMPVSAEKAKLQYLAANGEYVDIKNSEFNIGEWNELKLTVYSNYDNADLSLGGVALGEVYSDIGVNKLATFEMGSASVQGASDIFCIDNLSVASSTVEDIEIIPGDFISPETGKECAHRFNIGGYCKMCGALGNPVTFNDGNSGKALTAGEGIYSQIDYDQFWDYLDTDGLLFGNDFMFVGKFTFNEWDNQEADGNTRLFTLANGEVNDTNAYLAVELYTNNNKLEMGISAEERVALRLGTEYDIRVAVRAATSADGNYSNRAEIYLNDQLLWIKEFTISGENAIGVRLGDNVARSSMVKYDVKNDFGIFFLDNSIEYIGMQEKEDANYEEDSAFDLRFVFGLDDLYLEDVGIKVDAAISGGSTVGNIDGSITASSYRNVFGEVSVGGEVCKPVVNGAGGGGYYLALAIKDVELDTTATYTFTLTPYIKLHETEAESFMPYSYEITVSFENNQIKVGFEEVK